MYLHYVSHSDACFYFFYFSSCSIFCSNNIAETPIKICVNMNEENNINSNGKEERLGSLLFSNIHHIVFTNVAGEYTIGIIITYMTFDVCVCMCECGFFRCFLHFHSWFLASLICIFPWKFLVGVRLCLTFCRESLAWNI